MTLPALLAEIAACRVCRDAPRHGAAPLPHEPRPVVVASPAARIVVAGQAPGARVHESGVPFTDRSGDRLRAWMGIGAEMFHDRGRVAIVPMGFCFPGNDAKGGDLPPRRECRDIWHGRLFEALPAPDLMLMVGLEAQRYHLPRLGLGGLLGADLTATVADWRRVVAAREQPRVYPLPHPSWRNTGWLKAHPWFEAELLPILRADIARFLVPRRAGEG